MFRSGLCYFFNIHSPFWTCDYHRSLECSVHQYSKVCLPGNVITLCNHHLIRNKSYNGQSKAKKPFFILTLEYRKIPKISPAAYIFQRPFLGLIFGGAYIRRGLSTERNLRFKIDWASLIVGSKFIVFALYLRAIFQVQPPGELIFGGVI